MTAAVLDRVPRIGRLPGPVLASCAVIFVVQFTIRKAIQQPETFLIVGLNGLTLAGLYFLVASGFTLIFGLMRVTNLAHGSLYLFGGYVGYSIQRATGSWLAAVAIATVTTAVLGILGQQTLLRWIQGQDMREALVTLGLSIVAADQLLANWGGDPISIQTPGGLSSSIDLHLGGGVVYPTYRLAVLGIAIGIGFGLWILLQKTLFGMAIRAGVDNRRMVDAMGVNVQVIFGATFFVGAALAGLAGVVGGTFLSVAPGEDGRILLVSLVVVIVGGLGSVAGVALGAVLVGLVEQYAALYVPEYAALVTFGMMIVVLVVRPQGLLGRAQ